MTTPQEQPQGPEAFAWLWESLPWTGGGAWGQLVNVAILIAVCWLLVWLIRGVLMPAVRSAAQRNQVAWDDVLVDHGVLKWLSYLVPTLLLQFGTETIPHLDQTARLVLGNLAQAATVLTVMMAVGCLLNGLNAVYSRREAARQRPIKGYVQIAKIFLYIVGSVLALCVLSGQDPALLLGGIGAMSAVLLLVFKDTILSLVASIQLTQNDMIRVGDWIEMSKYGADGDVIDIALHTVKVQNWDKTITTIPTYALISESFRNWRGMQASGGRRVKRSLLIDLSTVRFLDDAEVDEFGEWELLADYIAGKKQDLAKANEGKDAPHAHRRRLTNLGTFRAYITAYLKARPDIREDMTFLVRQLQPTTTGIPLEIYLFTKTIKWAEYEAIQADVFDHLLAISAEFDLDAYQQPSSRDVAGIADALAEGGAA